MRRLRALLPLLLLIVTGAVLVSSGALRNFDPRHLAAEHAHLHQLAAASPWLARALYVGALTLSIATGIPGSLFVILGGGMLFGIAEGSLLSSIGLTLGSLLLFLASRYAFGSGERAAPALAERLRAGFQRHPLSYTLFLRLVPVFPFGGVTLALAWLRCPLWLFLAATAGGGTLMLVFETAVGAGLSGAISSGRHIGFGLFLEPHVLLPLGALSLLALLPVLLGRRRD